MTLEPTLALVVPVLNEAALLKTALAELARHDAAQIIVVDGGSADDSAAIAGSFAQKTPNLTSLASKPGRARQMNAGAAVVSADLVCFVHADSTLPDDAVQLIRRAVRSGAQWGRFDVRFDQRHILLRLIAWFMNRRSALTGICTGDQCIWMRRELFVRAGGYADIPLMEDIELSRRLKRHCQPHRLRVPAKTSARRWLSRGIVRTMLLMWWLRLLYWAGVPAQRLAKKYR